MVRHGGIDDLLEFEITMKGIAPEPLHSKKVRLDAVTILLNVADTKVDRMKYLEQQEQLIAEIAEMVKK